MTTAVARKRRVDPVGGTHFREFVEFACRHTKGRWHGEHIGFEPWQTRDWNEVLQLNSKNKRLYRFALLGRPRKNYKTTECAALGLYLSGPEGERAPDVAVGSGSLDQAMNVFGTARDMVRLDPWLSQNYVPFQTSITCPRKYGVLRRVSSEGGLAMGLNLSGAVLDELHVFGSTSHVELYNALVTASGSREEPVIVSITTAGWDKTSLLGRLYESSLRFPEVETKACRTVARDAVNGSVMIWYGAPEGADPEDKKILRQCNPAASIDVDELLKDLYSGRVTEAAFRRLYMNQWVKVEELWLPPGCWNSLLDQKLQIPDGADIVVGVDAALKYDTTAVSWAWKAPDGRCVLRSKVWSARPEAPHHVLVPGGRIDNELPEMFIVRELARRYRVLEVAYDPKYFDTPADHLSRAGLQVTEIAQQSSVMADAYQAFYAAATGGDLAHDGETILTQHVESAAAVMTERGWKLYKLKASSPFDALAACVMAVSRLKVGQPNVDIHWL